jgi:hypothetical protein
MLPSIVELLPKIKRQRDLVRHFFNVRFRDPEQGGYVHDTAMSAFMPLGTAFYTVGTFTDTAGAVAGTYMKRLTAAANSPFVDVPICIPQNSVALKGGYLKSLDIFYIIGTAALTTLTATIRQMTVPANAAAYPAAVAPAFTYDSNHTSNANRVTAAQHTMTLTITTPYWLANTEQDHLELTIVNPGTAVFDLYGVRANFTMRL